MIQYFLFIDYLKISDWSPIRTATGTAVECEGSVRARLKFESYGLSLGKR